MIIRLQHQRSDGDMDTYHLKSGRRYHIGRGSNCEVRILDLKLSRKHCAVEYTEGEWRVIDLASTNGCKVDGDQIVGSQPLKNGTAIEIGQSTIKVSRILGDDEDGDDENSADEHAAAEHTDTSKVDPDELAAVEQEPLPMDDKDSATSAPSDHSANDWEPEPEAELSTKTGALTPNAQADSRADKALDAARKAAVRAVEDAGSLTGQVQKSSPALPPAVPVAPAKPAVLRHPTPLPMQASELESGPYTSLDRNGSPDVRGAKPAAPRPAPPARTDAKAAGTETRRRQQIMPIIVQPMSDDEIEATRPVPPAPEPVNLDATSATLPMRPAAPAPVAPAPTPAPVTPASPPSPGAPAADDRTFFITVLGRRVGPLTRAVARDLKARELKGTLTLKDLDQFK